MRLPSSFISAPCRVNKMACSLFFILLAAAHAGPKNSAGYAIITDTLDAGGKRAASASYTNDSSAGGVVGISTVAAPVVTMKHGYIGQLSEVTALQLAATPATVNETATRQLSGSLLLDDLTISAVPAASITWSIVSGPLTSISTGGLATAGTVYQTESATAQGSHAGTLGIINLTILDTIADNFGSYAGDGLADDWQVVWFGQNNPLAGPLVDYDHDGFNNLFEFTAGTLPNDALSFFTCRIESVPGFLTHKNLIFSPIMAGRTYTVKSSITLGAAATWSSLTGFLTSNNGVERTVTDTAATGDAKFYTVEIVKP